MKATTRHSSDAPPQAEPTSSENPIPRAAYSRAEEIKLLYASVPAGTLLSALVAVATLVAMWGHAHNGALVAWLVLLLLVTFARWLLAQAFAQQQPSVSDMPVWERRFVLNAFLSGLTWGALAIFFFPADSNHQVFLAFLLAGLAAGSSVNLASVKSGVLAFVVPCLTPLAMRLFLEDEGVTPVMGVMIVFFLFTVTSGAGRIYRNIHDNVELRLQAMAREEELAQAQRRLSHILMATPVVLYTMLPGRRNRLTFVSHNVKDILGYNASTFLSQAGFWLDRLHPEDSANHLSQLASTTTRSHRVSEYRFKRADGSYRWILDEFRVTWDEQRGETEVVGYWADITSRKEAEQALKEAKKQAEEASTAKTRFLSNVSHELRTPLNAILGFAQLMELDETLSDENKSSLFEILRSGEHLLSLVDDVLELTQIQSRQLNLSLEPVCVIELVQHCVDLNRNLYPERQVEVVIEDMDENVEVWSDRMRLKKVLCNLISNAIKYNHVGGTVEISARQEQNDWRIRIHDNGPGIPANLQHLLFQPFNHVGSEASSIPGTGMGLVIAKDLTEAMGGHIELHSTEGEGTTAWLSLPRSPRHSH